MKVVRRPRGKILTEWLIVGIVVILAVVLILSMPKYVHAKAQSSHYDRSPESCGVTLYVSDQTAKGAGCQ